MSYSITEHTLRELASLVEADLIEGEEICEIHMSTNGATGKVDVVLIVGVPDPDVTAYGGVDIEERKLEL